MALGWLSAWSFGLPCFELFFQFGVRFLSPRFPFSPGCWFLPLFFLEKYERFQEKTRLSGTNWVKFSRQLPYSSWGSMESWAKFSLHWRLWNILRHFSSKNAFTQATTYTKFLSSWPWIHYFWLKYWINSVLYGNLDAEMNLVQVKLLRTFNSFCKIWQFFAWCFYR